MPMSHEIRDSLHLIRQTVSQTPATAAPVETTTNHVVAIDCSGSMAADLPKIREQLKRKLPKLLKERDTITLIWFSGRGEYGVLLQGEPVASLTDLQTVERAIDRWLKPIGLTSFQGPIEEAKHALQLVSKKYPDNVGSLLFLSDGFDNCGTKAKILEAVGTTATDFASTTIVEYGYYADRALLSAMAERAGGSHIFAEDFDQYDPSFESVLQKKQSDAKRIEIPIEGDAIGGFVFAVHDNDLTTYAITDGRVKVPENLSDIWYLSPTAIGNKGVSVSAIAQILSKAKASTEDNTVIAAAYAAVSLFSVRMRPNVVYPVLQAIGDVRLVDSFAGCFGKQAYSDFQTEARKAAFGADRYTNGFDPDRVPADDAFTVLELLQLLSSDDNNRVLLDHEDFRYNRIGRGRVDALDQISPEKQAEIAALTQELTTTKDAKRIAKISSELAALTASVAPLQFKEDPAPDGYPISSLTFNADRPNISFLIRKPGTIDVSSKAPKELNLPESLPTFVFRNYAVIRDGLVNIDKLPVLLTERSLTKLSIRLDQRATAVLGTPSKQDDGRSLVTINLRALPVINRQMIKSVTAEEFFGARFELLKAQAERKVLDAYTRDLFPEAHEAFKSTYGEAAATWLTENGFTNHSGFSPKSVQAPATDFYLGKELRVTVKGYSKLPSLADVKDQIAKNKTNATGALMAPTVNQVEEFLASNLANKAPQESQGLRVWLDHQTKGARDRVRDHLYRVAQTTFAIIVGQVWFDGTDSLESSSFELPLNGPEQKPVRCEAVMHEVEVKI